MCGIFGYIGRIKRSDAIDCIDMIAHRGPDGRGIWQNDDITLAHRRLSIIDLSPSGDQPMSYADGRYWIVYNGEIYNFIELRRILESKGHKFKTDSDTEIILAAYCEWGEKCLEKFNGMWAFAIWDGHTKRLFLSRDRFGVKPLYYYRNKGSFAFASEMKALFPLMKSIVPNVDLVRNTSKIFEYEHTSECLIKSIQRFPAGHYGWFTDGELRIKRWWCTLDHLMPVPDHYQDQVDQFRDLFTDACKLRMRSDVPIGSALSGGLDSSAVIGTVAHIGHNKLEKRINKNWQNAFIACFPGTALDEKYYAEKVTDFLKIKPNFINIDPSETINKLYRYLYLFEDNYNTSPVPFMMTYGAMKKAGIKVTLDGHGADEILGGYNFDFINTLHDVSLNPIAAYLIVKTYADSVPSGWSQFKRINNPQSFLLSWYKSNWRNILIRNNRFFDTETADSTHNNWKNLDVLTRKLYISTHETILPTLLRNYDRYSMANGVEIRMPFMDYRVICFAFSIPWSSKIRNGYAKSIIRDAVSDYLPKEIVRRKTKIGFNTPIVDWMKKPLKSFFLNIIHEQSFKECTLIDPRKTAELIKDVIDKPDISFSQGQQAWNSISPYLWEQAIIKGKGAKKI